MTLLQLSGGAGPLDHIVLPHKADIAIFFAFCVSFRPF